MSWLSNLIGGHQQEGSQKTPPVSHKVWEREQYDLGFEEGGEEDESVSVYRNRGRETHRELYGKSRRSSK